VLVISIPKAKRPIAYALASLLVARKIPFDDPEVLLYVRVGYVTVQLVVLAVYFTISSFVRVPLRPTSSKCLAASSDQEGQRQDCHQVWYVYTIPSCSL